MWAKLNKNHSNRTSEETHGWKCCVLGCALIIQGFRGSGWWGIYQDHTRSDPDEDVDEDQERDDPDGGEGNIAEPRDSSVMMLHTPLHRRGESRKDHRFSRYTR